MITWAYLNAGKKQHALWPDALTMAPMHAAVCGCQVLAALPVIAKWQHDPTGLEGREKCKQCLKVLEKHTHV